MVTAIKTTKLPMLANDGFWVMAHASRTDFAMLLGSLFLRSWVPGRFRGMHGARADRVRIPRL